MCFYDTVERDYAVMWAMKEYGVEKSWTRMFAVMLFSPCPVHLVTRNRYQFVEHVDLLFLLNDDEILIADHYEEAVGVNTKRVRAPRVVHPKPFLLVRWLHTTQALFHYEML